MLLTMPATKNPPYRPLWGCHSTDILQCRRAAHANRLGQGVHPVFCAGMKYKTSAEDSIGVADSQAKSAGLD